MELLDAIELIQHPSIPKERKTNWADLGCGDGLFTRALVHLLLPGSKVFAVDSNQKVLTRMEGPSVDVTIEKIKADFVGDDLPFHNLDGLLMANALHFVRDQVGFLKKAGGWLKPGGCFLIVEYDTDRANPWVPYPLSYKTLSGLFKQLGYSKMEKWHERSSLYNRAPIYSAFIPTR